MEPPVLKGWVHTVEGWVNVAHISMIRPPNEIYVGAGELAEVISDKAAVTALLAKIEPPGIFPEPEDV